MFLTTYARPPSRRWPTPNKQVSHPPPSHHITSHHSLLYIRLAMTTAYPTKLASQNSSSSNNNGTLTPSHGGTVIGGHEFDIPIIKSPSSAAAAGSRPTPSTAMPASSSAQGADQLQPLPDPVPRTSTGASRPRPVSMPPQVYNPGIPPISTPNPPAGSDGQGSEIKQRQPSKSGRSSNRILGDYTLSKTLGAGSMGKVKLATHNVTGEKV